MRLILLANSASERELKLPTLGATKHPAALRNQTPPKPRQQFDLTTTNSDAVTVQGLVLLGAGLVLGGDFV